MLSPSSLSLLSLSSPSLSPLSPSLLSSLCHHGIFHGHCIVVVMLTQGTVVVVVGSPSSLSCHCHCVPHCHPPHFSHPPPHPHCCHRVTVTLAMCVSLLLVLAWPHYHHCRSGWVSGGGRVMGLMRSGGDEDCHCLNSSGEWMNVIITDYNWVSAGGGNLRWDLWGDGDEHCCCHVVMIVMDWGGGCGSGGWGWWVDIVIMLHCGCKWAVSVTT